MTSDLVVAEHGSGAPVLAIHGGLGLDHTYLRTLDALPARVIYPDLRGNGRSPRPVSFDGIDHTSWAADLDQVRADRGLERWTVLGHSYGSFIALAYALAFPERVERLILLGAGATFQHGDAVAANVARKMPDRVAEIMQVLSIQAEDDAHFARVWADILPLYYHRYTPAYLERFAETRYSAAAYNHGATFLATYDRRPQLAQITAPALVISADDDWIMPPDRAGAPLAAGLPRAEHVVIPNAGHFMFHEAPDLALGAIARFLSAR